MAPPAPINPQRGAEQQASPRYLALAELTLDLAALRDAQALIERACAGARSLLDARYAVLAAGVPGIETRSTISGITSAVLPPPSLNAGWLGGVWADRITRRLLVPEGSPERLGLPAGYPAVYAALAAPLVSASDCHGWLCVATSNGAVFSNEDEHLLTLLAAHVGRLYETAALHERLREESGERQRSNVAMLAVLQRLEALRALDAEILAARSPRGVVRVGLEHLAHLVPYWGASVTMMNANGNGAIVLASATGTAGSPYNPGQYLTMQQYGKPDLEILRRGEIRDVPDIEALSERPPVIESLYRQGMRSYARIPMLVEGNLIGTLNLGSDRKNFFAREQLEFARSVANQLGIAAQQAALRERIARQSAELEQRVNERTAQLAAANEDLEAFSYTVSHDLRAPLRAVDGFSRMFEEDYGTRLDAQGRHLLATIRGNAQRMSLLIDDLLKFAQLGRTRLSTRPLEMTDVVREAWEELAAVRDPEGTPSADIEFRLAELPAAQADYALIKQVWLNLLSNARKYSGKREHAVIEVSSYPHDTEVVFRIADNGAGFDMRYYEKLFGVFQRLHSNQEFPGTGVGLAMVQRVVSRHGGRVWAESVLDEGAQFYFTLPAVEEVPHPGE